MDIQSLLDNYINWLKSEITFSQIGEYYEITTPFLDPSNDYLQIYVKQEDMFIQVLRFTEVLLIHGTMVH